VGSDRRFRSRVPHLDRGSRALGSELAHGGDVEFEVKIGGLSVKKKFKLKDMVFHGRLEL